MAYFSLRKAKDSSFYFTFHGGNHEIVGVSETYVSKQSAIHGISSVKSNAKFLQNFTLFQGRDSRWYFNLRAGNGEIVLQSQGYSSEYSARAGVGVVNREAPDAPTYDHTADSAA